VPGKDRLAQLAGEVWVAGQQLAGVGIYDPEALLPEGLVQRRLAALHSQEGSQLRSRQLQQLAPYVSPQLHCQCCAGALHTGAAPAAPYSLRAPSALAP
jgi:hypothetical protein